jgi:hypothetical protein
MSKRKTSVSNILNSSKKFVSNFWDKYNYADEYEAHSNYWLKGSIFDKKTSMFAEPEEKGSKYDYHALAQYQRAITNFVHILTADPTIKVQYNSAGNNSTDGRTINLSATMKEEDFDANVGLALHESSHILYTDFEKSINEFLYPNVDKILLDETASKLRENDGETKQTILGRTFGWEGYKQNFKTILNIIEDLYIDAMTYSNAPGYRAYYKSLYHKYFGDEKISRGFWQLDMCQPTMDNYMFHLCNFRSPARNLKALPELETIWNLIDMRNIRRLSEQQDRIDLAYKVYSTIIGQIADYKVDDSQKEKGGEGEGDGEQGDFGGDDGIGDSQSDGNIGTNSKWTPPTPDADQNIKPLSDKQIEQLRKLVERQKDFINGQLTKSKLSKQDASKVDAFASVDMNQNNVAKGFEDDCGRVHSNGIKVYTIKRLTEKFMQSDVSRPFGVYAREQGWRLDRRTKDIESAISLGKLLAKRLQIRNEERVDKSTRLRSGKIDKRLLHEIGFDNYEIFNKISINKYKDSYIHLSIDASGSMQGDKFDESVKLAAMFATASKLIRNLRVVVTARSTINQNYYGYSNNKSKSDMNETPYMVYLFDSKQDGIADIRRIFPRLYSTNTTPEGLTFEAIMNDIYKESTNTDAFFINLCDGQPFMSKEISKYNLFRYAGHPAQDHSRRQVDRMRSHGINVLTYFIGRKYDFEEVLKCYKTNCHHLANAEELNKVVQSMNAELLSASRKTHG